MLTTPDGSRAALSARRQQRDGSQSLVRHLVVKLHFAPCERLGLHDEERRPIDTTVGSRQSCRYLRPPTCAKSGKQCMSQLVVGPLCKLRAPSEVIPSVDKHARDELLVPWFKSS